MWTCGAILDVTLRALTSRSCTHSVWSGDLMGSALDDIDSLLRMPTGCGEQNMLKFAPNIFVMQYLSSVDRVTNEINATSTKFLQAGAFSAVSG